MGSWNINRVNMLSSNVSTFNSESIFRNCGISSYVNIAQLAVLLYVVVHAYQLQGTEWVYVAFKLSSVTYHSKLADIEAPAILKRAVEVIIIQDNLNCIFHSLSWSLSLLLSYK